MARETRGTGQKTLSQRELHPVSITRFPLTRFSPGCALLSNPFFHRQRLRFSRVWVRKDGNLVTETGCTGVCGEKEVSVSVSEERCTQRMDFRGFESSKYKHYYSQQQQQQQQQQYHYYSKHVQIYIYIYTYVYTYVYIYRERERLIWQDVCKFNFTAWNSQDLKAISQSCFRVNESQQG